MFGILVKKQMAEIFRGYFYDAKKNKKRSKISTILFMLMYVILMVGVVGGVFSFLAVQLCKPFSLVDMSWLYFLIMGMIAIALGAFGSVFNTFSGLYLSKDNDLLLSMPIPVRSILAARLMGVYLMGLMYSAVVIVPAAVVYWIVTDVTPVGIAGSILLILHISIIVLILSCVLGWCVAKISLKLKNKSFVTVLLSLVFFGLYYLAYFKAQELIQDLLQNALIYGNKVKDRAYPLYLFGRVGEGDAVAMLVFTIGIAAMAVFTFRLLAGSFIRIATASGKSGKAVYREKHEKRKSEFGALLTKEFKRFTSSPNYMLNCGLGTIFLPILGVAALIKGQTVLQTISRLFAGEEVEGYIVVIVITAVCLVVAMNDMVVPSVSLEGKNIWIAQSLPVQPWDALRAKLMVQILVTGIPVLFCDICMCIVLQAGFWELLLGVVVSVLFVLFMALFGLMLGLKMPNLTWTNELAPIKQSISVMIEMFGGWGFSLVIGGVYITVGWHMGAALYLVILTIVLIAVSVLLLMWLKKKGTEIFRWL